MDEAPAPEATEVQPAQPTAEVASEPAAAKEEAPPAAEPVAAPEPKKRGRGRPPGSKNKPKATPIPAVNIAPERAAAPVPAPVAAPEPAPVEPEEPPPTPSMMRAMRQVARADRFEELLTRNTMEF